jgi:hypothetical protein
VLGLVPVLFKFGDRVLGEPSLFSTIGLDAQARCRAMPERGHHLFVSASSFRHANACEMP